MVLLIFHDVKVAINSQTYKFILYFIQVFGGYLLKNLHIAWNLSISLIKSSDR